MEQRTNEWYLARLGKVTASKIADVIARTKSGFSTSRENYKAQLVAEIMTGKPYEGFKSAAMQDGIDREPAARQRYADSVFEDVTEVGFVDHPDILGAGCSPDGLVGDDGIIEIKCPNTATYLEILLTDNIPLKWNTQIQMQLDCTGRKWCDFVCYDPRMPEGAQLYVQRVERDEIFIATMREMIITFIKELHDDVQQIKAKIKEKQNAQSLSK